MDQIVYLDGRLMPLNQAAVSVLNYGFLYGYGLFETMRAYDGQVFRMEAHLARLSAGARITGLTLKVDLKDAIKSAIEANRLDSARIRLSISGGVGEINADPGTCAGTTILILAQKYEPLPESAYEEGFSAIISAKRRHTSSHLAGLKAASYMENILAKQEARLNGVDESVCLNENGLVSEASMGNIFIVSGGTLVTPAPDSGILAGVTRDVVLEIAARLKLRTSQQNIRRDDLLAADEAFLTSSLIEIMPLVEIEHMRIGSGKPGAVTHTLLREYRKLVRQTPGN